MKRRIQPDIIITSAKQEDSFLQVLREGGKHYNQYRHYNNFSNFLILYSLSVIMTQIFISAQDDEATSALEKQVHVEIIPCIAFGKSIYAGTFCKTCIFIYHIFKRILNSSLKALLLVVNSNVLPFFQ